jgi:hypothetical protein
MAYRKSYYQQRTEEQARIREAIRKQHEEAAAKKAAEEGGAPAPAPQQEAPADEPVVQTVKPDESWTKAEIQEYLDKQKIQYSRWMTKAKLLSLVD